MVTEADFDHFANDLKIKASNYKDKYIKNGNKMPHPLGIYLQTIFQMWAITWPDQTVEDIKDHVVTLIESEVNQTKLSLKKETSH